MHCQAITKAGTSCRRKATVGNYCWQHQQIEIKENKQDQNQLIPDLENIMSDYLDVDSYIKLVKLYPEKYSLQKYKQLIKANPDKYTNMDLQTIEAEILRESQKSKKIKHDDIKLLLYVNIREVLEVMQLLNILRIDFTEVNEVFGDHQTYFAMIKWLNPPKELQADYQEYYKGTDETFSGDIYITQDEPYTNKLIFESNSPTQYILELTPLFKLLDENIRVYENYINK